MKNKLNILVLISGRGSNLSALLKNQEYFNVKAVLSDKDQAEGLILAKDSGVFIVESYPREKFESKLAQKQAIYSRIKSISPDLIVLAGFMQVLDVDFVDAFFGKIINIHPSLLPNFPGLNTHARAIEAKAKQHGCTVHFVDNGLDTGPKISQASCNIAESDDANSLSLKVLELEHRLYPWTVNAICSKQIYLKEKDQNVEVFVSPELKDNAVKLGFIV